MLLLVVVLATCFVGMAAPLLGVFPMAIALPDRSASILTVLNVNPVIPMIDRPVVDLVVWSVVRIPVQTSIGVAR